MSNGLENQVMAAPMATVVFSSYNGSKRLRRTLDSLVAQDFPAENWELVAVDNNSADDTMAVLESYRGKLPIKPFRHPVPGKSGALNRAIELARGELVVFTDDDVEAEPTWLSALVACAQAQPEFGIFGGRIVPDWERAPDGQAFLDWIPMGSTFAVVDDAASGPCDPTKVWGPNTAIRRRHLATERYREDIGPLPGGLFAMGEDSEIVLRLARQGVKTYRCGEAVIHHFVPASSMTEKWVQKRAERLGYGMPVVFPEEVPRGPRLNGVPLDTWAESASWAIRSALLYPLPSNRLRFWAIWKHNYMRGYRAGIRRYAPVQGAVE
ncbi:MAG TPA: glycosyltransferase family 2 protein [Devosiaceae bacterium]|nr:glycosyltransferase family 2 protein [Devosiaceae bacterium]